MNRRVTRCRAYKPDIVTKTAAKNDRVTRKRKVYIKDRNGGISDECYDRIFCDFFFEAF